MKFTHSHWRRLVIWMVPIALAAGNGCKQAGPPPVADVGSSRVMIDNFTFTPAKLTVSSGTTVTWTNRDDVPHTVTADDKRFSSQPLDTDDHFSHRFDAPGA